SHQPECDLAHPILVRNLRRLRGDRSRKTGRASVVDAVVATRARARGDRRLDCPRSDLSADDGPAAGSRAHYDAADGRRRAPVDPAWSVRPSRDSQQAACRMESVHAPVTGSHCGWHRDGMGLVLENAAHGDDTESNREPRGGEDERTRMAAGIQRGDGTSAVAPE